MGRTVTLTLDDETAAYLEQIAADQGRTPGDVAAWIVTEDLRRERTIDAALIARVDDLAARAPNTVGEAARERAGA